MREHRLSYNNPPRDSAGGVQVCRCFVSAGLAPELGLAFPVALSIYPHTEHSLLVLRGSIATTGTPARVALDSTKARSWPKDQLCKRFLCALLALTCSRIPF